jgi:type I restriction enzyme, S subunit
MAVVPGDDLVPEYLLAYLETRDLASLSDGSNVPQINHGDIAPLELPLSPLEEQRRIVAEVEKRLSAIDALRGAIERAQRRSAALRRAVLERAFRGELVSQDPSDEPAGALLARIRAEAAIATKPAGR